MPCSKAADTGHRSGAGCCMVHACRVSERSSPLSLEAMSTTALMAALEAVQRMQPESKKRESRLTSPALD